MRIVYPTTFDNIHRGKFRASWSYLHGEVEYDHGYDIFTCNEAMQRAISRSEPDEEFTCTIICPTTYKRRDGVAIWMGDEGRQGKPWPFVYVCYADDTEAIEGARAYRDRNDGFDSGISGDSYYRVVWYNSHIRSCLRNREVFTKEWLRENNVLGKRAWFMELQYNERTKDIVFRFGGEIVGNQYYRANTDDIEHAKRMCRLMRPFELEKMGFLTPVFQTNKRGTIQ